MWEMHATIQSIFYYPFSYKQVYTKLETVYDCQYYLSTYVLSLSSHSNFHTLTQIDSCTFEAVPCNSIHCFNREMRKQVKGEEERMNIKKETTLMEKQTQYLKT
jgi:hypothetical protein